MKNTSRVLLIGSLSAAMLAACVAPPMPSVSNTLAEGDRRFSVGDTVGALDAWQPFPAINDEQRILLALRQSKAYRQLGQIGQALALAENLPDMAERQNDPRILPEALLETGETYLAAGRSADAEEILKRAAGMPAAQADAALAARLETALGRAMLQEGQTGDAITHLNKALHYAETAGDKDFLLETAIARLEVWRDANRQAEVPNQALQLVEAVRALPGTPGGDLSAIKLARLLMEGNSRQQAAALSLLADAAASCAKRGDSRWQSYALGYQGRILESQGRWREAADLTAQAAYAAQRDNAQESLYLWEWQAARLLQRQGQPGLALDAYRRAIFNWQAIRADLGAGAPFREKVSPLFSAFTDLLLQKAYSEANPAAAENWLGEARNTLEQLKSAELQDYFQDNCVAKFKEKSKGLETVSAHTAVLYPILLPDRLAMLVGFDDGLRQFVTPVGAELLTAQIREFRRKLEKRTTFQYLQPAKQLYQWLIAPLLPELQRRGITTLVVVPDAALRTIPLAALHDGEHYLLENFAVATTPGLALTDPQPLPKEKLDILLNGLTEPVQGFPGLPNVEEEIGAIQALSGGTVLKNQEFQLDAVAAAMENNSFRIVHIASHGQFDRDPHKTFLLTYNNKLTMDLLERYISTGKYRDKPVELLTLSACQTAVGDERSALGLAGVAVKAGARSALATLWFINDQASSGLITAFYRNLAGAASKAEALRHAQLQLMQDPRYRHAGYWAAFLIIGNWL